MERDQETTQHPAFGQIEFIRVSSGGGQSFYGSELPQQNYMEIRIHKSELIRDLTHDRYHDKKCIFSARLTAIQFSELITSFNIGSGVPCTITQIGDQQVEKLPPLENRKTFVHRQFKNRMKQFADTLKEKSNRAKELTAKKTLSKADQEELANTIRWLTQEVAENIPYFAECFQETTDKVVVEAKAEVENAILHKINTLGLNALHEQKKLLTDGK